MPQRAGDTDQRMKGLLTPAATPSPASSESVQVDTNSDSPGFTALQHKPKARKESSQTTKSQIGPPKSTRSNKKSGNAPYNVQHPKLPKDQPGSTTAGHGAKAGEAHSGVDEAFRRLRESMMTTGEQTAAEPPSQFVFTAPTTQSKEPALEFVSWSHPSQPESCNVRRLIRAHVGRTSHPANVRLQGVRKVPHAPTLRSKVPTSRNIPDPDANKGPEPDGCTVVRSRSEKLREHDLDYQRDHPQDSDTKDIFIEPATDPIGRLVLNDHSHELGIALARLGCDLDLAMGPYNVISNAQIPTFESQFGTLGDSRKRALVPFLLSDPCLTLMIVFLAVTHKLWMTGANARGTDVTYLKGLLISALNSAIQDPNRAITDQVLFAVVNLAGYELMFGSKELYDVHMNGLIKMIRLRGGMGHLGCEGNMETMLHWHDANFSSIAKGEPYLKGLASTPRLHAAKPDLGAITVGIIKTQPE